MKVRPQTLFYITIFQMNFLFASSRGAGLHAKVDPSHRLISHVKPGGTIEQLEILASKCIPPPHLYKETPHAYLLAGIPNITQKIKGNNNGSKYTECIYTNKPENTIQDIKEKIDNFEKTIKEKKAIPIFCTITSISIALYNQHLLKTNKTSELKHSHNYPQMQTEIDDIIYKINYYLIGKNIANKVSTPYLHSATRTKKGNKNRTTKTYFYSDNWDRFTDGLHANDETKTKWAQGISRAIELNRGGQKKTPAPKPSSTNITTLTHSPSPQRKRKQSSSSEEAFSPKRSWRRERKEF